tara:strand:+ start:205 stop:858 length:654 start_codon:yes stop_codon:yes gene_type:complete
MKLLLDTITIEPASGEKPQNAIVLLHGFGGSGKDISMLTINWKRFLPDTVFLCPNAHQECSISPSGYQWFDLSKDDNESIFKSSLLAEQKINEYISQIKNIYELKNKSICLVGFSQGCMMALNVGLTSNEKFNCIVGFSGKIINQNNLLHRIKSKQKIFLFHGDKDIVVSPTHLLESKEFLIKSGNDIKIKLLKNCEHNIPVEASSLALKFIKKNLY